MKKANYVLEDCTRALDFMFLMDKYLGLSRLIYYMYVEVKQLVTESIPFDMYLELDKYVIYIANVPDRPLPIQMELYHKK